jgi:hypothetical protein
MVVRGESSGGGQRGEALIAVFQQLLDGFEVRISVFKHHFWLCPSTLIHCR